MYILLDIRVHLAYHLPMITVDVDAVAARVAFFEVYGVVVRAKRSCRPFSITRSDMRDALLELL
jgi:hypothetical protein